MDYEKKYNEALSIAKETYETQPVYRAWLEKMFPELRESEDERVRNGLIGVVSDITGGWPFENHKITKKEAITYLEKQKDHFRDDTKMVEQKPAQTDDEKEYIRTIKSIISDFIRDKKPEDVAYYQRIYDWLDGRHIEQKPAEWSEEDADILNCCISSIEEAKENRYAYKETDGDTSYDREIDWLKSLRPQPQQNMSISFMLYLDEHRPDGKMCLSNAECNEIETAFKNQSWDTILRYVEKYQPVSKESLQPHWKPSEEQIKWLKDVIETVPMTCRQQIPLESLYNDLKKLM